MADQEIIAEKPGTIMAAWKILSNMILFYILQYLDTLWLPMQHMRG